MSRYFKLIALFVSSLVHQTASEAAGVAFIPLGDFAGGDFFSQAYGVSGDGSVVVGVGRTEDHREAFTWSNTTGMVSLGVPVGMRGSSAWGVSADGSVVVGIIEENPQPERTAFVWSASTGIIPLQGCACNNFDTATAVSGNGQYVVGRMFTSSGPRAFKWSESTGALNLGDLPGGNSDSQATDISHDGSVVVGTSGVSEGYHAFRWTADTGLSDLGNFQALGESEALAVSSDGSVVVGYGTHSPTQEAARWTAGDGMIGLGDLPGGSFLSYAHGVSDDGSVVVGGSMTERGFEAFRWTEQSGMRSIQSILTELGVGTPGWKLEYAHGISRDGNVIVGTAINPDGNSEAFLGIIPATYVPEPNTLLLTLTAIVSLPTIRRKSRAGPTFGRL